MSSEIVLFGDRAKAARNRRDPGHYTRRQYHHPDDGDEPRADPYRAADMAWTAKVQRFLASNYSLHHFCADIECRQGFIKVYIPELMGAVNGYILHIRDLVTERDFRKGLHDACGEILERYRLPRARFNETEWKEAMARAPISLHRSKVPE